MLIFFTLQMMIDHPELDPELDHELDHELDDDDDVQEKR